MAQKVFILYPPISKMERYSSRLGNVGGQQLPLGIFYLASSLREKGYEVMVCDAEAERMSAEQILSRIERFAPRFVGISSTTVAFHRALEMAEAVKRAFPEIQTILGGPHITSNCDHAMAFSAFDYGVIGEGEVTFLELLNALSAGGTADHIEGIAFRRDGNVVTTKRRQYIPDLNMLPLPAYDLVKDMSAYAPPPSNYRTLPVMNIITSRGCPNECTFCDRNVFGRSYRERSAANVFAEIRHLYERYGIREFAFVDDTFLINKERIHDLFDRVRREGLSFPWTCMARINNVTYEFLKYLKENGCWNIAFGIESGDEQVLKVIRKNITPARVRTVIDWCAELGIETKGFFIIGHPTETVATIDKTIDFALSLKLNAVVVTINTPIPGSQQFAEAHRYGTLDTTDWAKFNYWRPVFVPAGLTEEVLLNKQEEFYLRFYMRPRIVGHYLRGFFGKGGLRRFRSVISVFLSRESMGRVLGHLLMPRKVSGTSP